MLWTVAVIGLRGNQGHELRRRLGPDIRLVEISVSRVFRKRTMRPDFVLCTRFVGHAAQAHLEKVCDAPVQFCNGGLSNWAAAIQRRRLGYNDAA